MKLRDAEDEVKQNPLIMMTDTANQYKIYKYCANAMAQASFFDYNHTRTNKQQNIETLLSLQNKRVV